MSDENDIDIYGDDIGGEVSFYIIITIIIINDIYYLNLFALQKGDNIYEGLELGDNDNGNTQTNDQNVNDTYEDIKPVIEEEPKPESFDTVKGEVRQLLLLSVFLFVAKTSYRKSYHLL